MLFAPAVAEQLSTLTIYSQCAAGSLKNCTSPAYLAGSLQERSHLRRGHPHVHISWGFWAHLPTAKLTSSSAQLAQRTTQCTAGSRSRLRTSTLRAEAIWKMSAWETLGNFSWMGSSIFTIFARPAPSPTISKSDNSSRKYRDLGRQCKRCSLTRTSYHSTFTETAMKKSLPKLYPFRQKNNAQEEKATCVCPVTKLRNEAD